MKNIVVHALILVVSVLLLSGLCYGEISRSFEMRYFTRDPNASGITDFKGETEIFDVEQRVTFLRQYADYARAFFNDVDLDTKVVTENEVQAALKRLKPQPLPTVRTRIRLTDWKYLGYRKDQDEEEKEDIRAWDRIAGVSVRDEALVITEGSVSFSKPITNLTWRMFLSWKARMPSTRRRSVFRLSKAAVVGFNENGNFFYISHGKEIEAGAYEPDRFYSFKIEADLDPESRRYNFFVNDEIKADFVPLASDCKEISDFKVEGVEGLVLDDIWGVGYEKTGNRKRPYTINTFIDEDFEARPVPKGFETTSYDDSEWEGVPYWPYAHGGERYRNQTLFLRTKVKAGDFKRAVLNLETVRPSGEVYVNGKLVKRVGRHPEAMDVTELVMPNAENLVALKIEPFTLEDGMTHHNTDIYTGWFAGLMELDLIEHACINDVFAYATSVEDPAVVRVAAELESQQRDIDGKVVIEFMQWYPEGSNTLAATVSCPVKLKADTPLKLQKDIKIYNPKLWSVDSPNLYKVRVVLEDSGGEALDDFVFTTGLRTVSQDGGIVRINGKAEMLNGPLIFQYLNPLDKISQWMYRPPLPWLVKQILMVKKQTGNTIRMSVHDTFICGTNDRRFAQVGDQLGIMYMWQTPTWVRVRDPQKIDLEGLPKYARVLRNHPSIVMWQPGNHPKPLTMSWYEKVFNALYAVDTSRMICPTAHFKWLEKGQKFQKEGDFPGNDDTTYPCWTNPIATRGTMEQTTGYRKDWSVLREFPDGVGMPYSVRMEYLNSKTHAWFDFENEESIGQPNWNNYRGKPMYRIYSYEKGYDLGTIGRILTHDEWKEHQAYQAFSAYEAYRKKRWLDYDGLNWCCMRSGPNTGTYMKPMMDYYDHAKLSFYTVKMAFQRILAGSKNVDVAYGPDDEIPVMVLNLGEARTVDVRIVVRDVDGKQVREKIYRDVKLKGGRTVTDLPAWKPVLNEQGTYIFEYHVMNK
jgi:hypothetical protein